MPTKPRTSLAKQKELLAKQVKLLEGDPAFVIDRHLLKVATPLYDESIKKDPEALRKAYAAYFQALLKVLEYSPHSDLFTLPLLAHINYLKDLSTGNAPAYLVAKKVGRKAPKSLEMKFRDLYIAASMELLMQEGLSQIQAAKQVSRWCSAEKVKLGGRSSTSSEQRIKRIRDEITYSSKGQYEAICADWSSFGDSKKEGSSRMIKLIKFMTY